MRVRLILLLSLIFFQNVEAQPFGNEWIDYTRSYYKIPITEEGIYRLNASDLSNVGINLAGLDPRMIQIHRNGEEQYLYIEGETDGSFDAGDFLLFYGKGNDGAADTSLYINRNGIPHTYNSLFTDTAFYYLSWGSVNGKRYAKRQSPALSGLAEAFYIQESMLLLKDEYFRGQPFSGRAYRSDYNDGEGWFSKRLPLGNSRTDAIATEDMSTSGPAPEIEILYYGQSNDVSVSPNHHTRFRIGKTSVSVNTTLFDTTFLGYKRILLKDTFARNLIGSPSTYLQAQVINDLGAGADNNAIAYYKISYPRSFDLKSSSSRMLNFDGNQSQHRLKFDNYSKQKPLLLDLGSNEIIEGILNAGNCELMISGSSQSKRLCLFDSTDTQTPALYSVQFSNVDPASNAYDYIIITHSSLLSAATSYANYRNSSIGGSYNPLIIETDELYDQYYFGLHHPLAIRNFISHLIKEQAVRPAYLLLLGKGYHSNTLKDPEPLLNRYAEDLVPTFGIPGSDNMITFGIDGNMFEPALPTGRISARNNAEVLAYLNKVQAYESAPRQEWQKNVMQVSGGQDEVEKIQFGAFIDDFERQLRGPKIGANLRRYDKDVSAPVTSDPKKLVIKNLNEGLLMYNYFGHGSATKIGVDVGESNEYSNTNKYPLMFFNGCSVGNCFSEGSIGEDFLLAPNRGAIAWLANSNLGYTSSLKRWADLFLKNMSDDLYGASLGDMMLDASDNYTVGNLIDVTQLQQITYQGDPAIKIYSSPNADYEITNSDIYLSPDDVTALSDSFEVVAIVKNLGRATNDSVLIQLERTFPDNSVVQYAQKIGPIFNRDTVRFVLKSPGLNSRGNNIFSVTADADGSLIEEDETNNTGRLQFFMPSNSVNLIYPLPYAIVSTNTVELVFQNNNLLAEPQNYLYEIDTSYKFDSPWKQAGMVNSQSLIRANVNLLGTDSTEYFWRAKIDLPPSEGGVWENGSFTFFSGSPDGWNQSTFGQFLNIGLDQTVLDTPGRRIEFVPNQEEYTVRVSRFLSNASQRQIGIRQSGFLRSGGFCGSNGVRIVVIDPVSQNPRAGSCGNGVSSQFDILNSAGRQDMRRFLAGIQQGDYVMMMTINNAANYLKLDSIPWYMSRLGADTNMLRAINNDNYAWCFIGQQGSPGFARQDTVFAPNAIADSIAEVRTTLFSRWYEGRLSSERIGPSSKWVEFSQQIGSVPDPQTDTLTYSVFAIDANGQDTLFYDDINTSAQNLAAIDANRFPYLRIEAFLRDVQRRTAPQLGRWTVLYDGIPEGSFVVDQDYRFESDSISEGDSLRISINFANISPFIFQDSLLVEYSLINDQRVESLIQSEKRIPLGPGQKFTSNLSLPTVGLSGINKVKLSVNREFEQPELSLVNNVISREFVINRDPYNPILDVTFDGRRIFDRDIVAPSTEVIMTIKDNNPLIDQADTTNFLVRYKKSTELNYERIYFADPNNILTLLPANDDGKAQAALRFKDLSDGVYDLSVEVVDMSGNPSGVRPYTISFEVINERSISHFYPYPNPFSTRMKFVYTLTGDRIPEDIMIQIFTVSGKIVREINRNDLEPIFIGNNISDFSWDGTDQYGDRLANGVYFYKVTVKDNGDDVKRASKEIDRNGEKFFKRNTGKIYLMR